MTMTPTQASSLAKDVYNLTDFGSINGAIVFLKQKYKDKINFSESNLLKGKTGGPKIIKYRTGFGFVLLGQEEFHGNAYFLFRGTHYKADWVTNVNVGISRSCYHRSVHDGFNQTFNSMKAQLEPFLASLPSQKVHTVHCIGHSLGGALATLCAEWIEKTSSYSPKLYTFGSPRVGMLDFASNCTNRLGPESVYRCYHKTDIVPMIPTWPFTHTPTRGASYYLPSPGLYGHGEYHKMKYYVASVKNQSWANLSSLKERVKTDKEVEDWLLQQGVITQSMDDISWLDRAIAYVVNKSSKAVGTALISGGATTFTLLDRLAYILKKGLDITGTVSKYVLLLMKKIMSFLGYRMEVESASLSLSFIRYVFQRLHEAVTKKVNQALSQLMVEGRTV